LVQRHSKSDFMAGAYVFPGGGISPSDGDAFWSSSFEPESPLLALEATPPERERGAPSEPSPADEGQASSPPVATDFAAPLLPEAEARAYAVAGCRELFEEAGVLLARPILEGVYERKAVDRLCERSLREAVHSSPRAFAKIFSEEGLLLDLEALSYFAHWVTPSAERRRFDARFYLARLPEGQEARHDGHETVASLWATPKRIFEAIDAGEWRLPPPTLRSVEELAQYKSCDEAIQATRAKARAGEIAAILPKLFRTEEGPGVLLPWDQDYAATAGAALQELELPLGAPGQGRMGASHPARAFASRIVPHAGHFCSEDHRVAMKDGE